jgi:hypothetical protein
MNIKTTNINKTSTLSTTLDTSTTSMRKIRLDSSPAHQKLPRVASTTRLALLDFLNKVARIFYTLAIKLVFVARDLTICVITVIHSAVLILLDFLLIFNYHGAAFVQKDVLAKQRKKWASAPAAQPAVPQTGRVSSAPVFKTTGTVNQQEEDKEQRFFEAHFVRMNELNDIRSRFWAFDGVSLRSLVLSTREGAAHKSPVDALTAASRIQSPSQLCVPSTRALSSECKYNLHFCAKTKNSADMY